MKQFLKYGQPLSAAIFSEMQQVKQTCISKNFTIQKIFIQLYQLEFYLRPLVAVRMLKWQN